MCSKGWRLTLFLYIRWCFKLQLSRAGGQPDNLSAVLAHAGISVCVHGEAHEFQYTAGEFVLEELPTGEAGYFEFVHDLFAFPQRYEDGREC